MNEGKEGFKHKREKAKMIREERRSMSAVGDSLEVVEQSNYASDETYASLVSRKILTVDVSNQSTYVQLGIGGATGWITGYMVGKVGKALAAGVGGTILLINMGTRAGYITVDWEKVDSDMRSASEEVSNKLSEQQANEDTQKLVEKGATFLRRNLVMVGGFAAGFFLGMAS